MSRYLIVTHRTALDPELRRRVTTLVAEDPEAEFAILVPEAPNMDFTWEGETVDVAKQRGEAAMEVLKETAGARVLRTAVGVSDPVQAIADELSTHHAYDTLVICTLPLGVSRWLKLDLVHQAERKFGLPVVHVVGHASAG